MLGMDKYMYFGGIGNPLVFSEKPQDYMKSFEKELLVLDIHEVIWFTTIKLASQLHICFQD